MKTMMRQTHPCDILLVGNENIEKLGLYHIARYLAKHKLAVDIESLSKDGKTGILKKIIATNPRIVSFSMIFPHTVDEFHELMYYLRSNGVCAHFTMEAHVPWAVYNKILKQIRYLDTLVFADSRKTLLELCIHIDSPESWNKIPCLACRKTKDTQRNPLHRLSDDLQSLPFPIRNLIPVA